MKLERYSVGLSGRWAIAIVAAATFVPVFSTAAIANDVEDIPFIQGVQFGSIPYQVEHEFFSNNREYTRNRTFTGQLKRIFGPFPENSMSRDLDNVHQIYLETQYKQMNSGPIIRTVDLQSPFQASLRTLPPPVVAAPIPPIGVEPPIITPPIAAPTAPVKPGPVPALW
ncbi:MAG: hypothetical protein IGS48_13245 [Oscillatoriales cyanobacterium C42_A2020_001]|nr:hypothetical protein [Leptolyngbyaceae cyanobacterium C42_A2020_001]